MVCPAQRRCWCRRLGRRGGQGGLRASDAERFKSRLPTAIFDSRVECGNAFLPMPPPIRARLDGGPVMPGTAMILADLDRCSRVIPSKDLIVLVMTP